MLRTGYGTFMYTLGFGYGRHIPNRRSPKDDINIRISHSGSTALYQGDTRNPVLLHPYVLCSFWALNFTPPSSYLLSRSRSELHRKHADHGSTKGAALTYRPNDNNRSPHSPTLWLQMGVSKNWGPLFGSPHIKSPSILGSILGPPIVGNSQIAQSRCLFLYFRPYRFYT